MDRRDARLSARVTDALLSVTGVVSVGVGRGPDGEPAVIVGVSRLSAEIRTALPERVEELPVVVREVGDISAR